MSAHHHTTDNSPGPGSLGRFTLGVSGYRCPCSLEHAGLYPADVRGRIVADPDWAQHHTVTCGGCGRYGHLADDTGTGVVPVRGVAALPAPCTDCGAERGQPCRDPFCPGQDVLDPVGESDPDEDRGLESVAGQLCTSADPPAEPVVYDVAALRAAVPSTTRIWRSWASQALDPFGPHRGRVVALRWAAQAAVEARRLRRGLASGPTTIRSGTEDTASDDTDLAELLDVLGGRGGTTGQAQAVQALRRARSWTMTVAAQLLDAAAIWRAAGRAPF